MSFTKEGGALAGIGRSLGRNKLTTGFIGLDAGLQGKDVNEGRTSVGRAAGNVIGVNGAYIAADKAFSSKAVANTVSRFLPGKLRYIGTGLSFIGSGLAGSLGGLAGNYLGKKVPIWKRQVAPVNG